MSRRFIMNTRFFSGLKLKRPFSFCSYFLHHNNGCRMSKMTSSYYAARNCLLIKGDTNVEAPISRAYSTSENIKNKYLNNVFMFWPVFIISYKFYIFINNTTPNCLITFFISVFWGMRCQPPLMVFSIYF